MHPALSVIFFTVTAGAGYGLFTLLIVARYSGLVPDLGPDQVVFMGLTGLLLVTLGLLSSTLHLANPKNAWRSFTRFRTSWLSREAVFAVLFYPVSIVWLISEWFGGASTLSFLMGLVTFVLAIAILICTAMIYASLKTIRQWHTPFTPVNFMVLGLMLGALVMLVIVMQQGLVAGPVIAVTISLLIVGAMLKMGYFAWIGNPAGPTINTALGFTRATVRLLDVGHSSGTFLTDEFGFTVARVKLMWLRAAVFVCAFFIPLLLLAGVFGTASFGLVLLGTLICWFGLFVERWLFFAEARHVVNLYHGAQST